MRFKIDCASFIFGINLPFLLCFPLYLRAVFQAQAPRGLYLEGRFNGGFFALPAWGAYFRHFTEVLLISLNTLFPVVPTDFSLLVHVKSWKTVERSTIYASTATLLIVKHVQFRFSTKAC